MSVVFNHGIRYQVCSGNPIRLVRQSAKRRRIPVVLSASEVQQLLDALALKERTLVLLDVGTGLRMSELFGHKTESSQKPIPLDPYLAEALRAWLEHLRYGRPEDWVFANPRMKGRQPYWGQEIMRRVIRPIAIQLGITKHIGWHTFGTRIRLLRANRADIKVMQELLRHAPGRVTMDTYTQAVSTKTQSAEWSDSFAPRPRNGGGNWGVSLCLFVPTKKSTNLGKSSCGAAGRRDLAVLLFLFVPPKTTSVPLTH